MNNNSITNKKILVTGGTGSFGEAVIKKLRKNIIEKIVVY